MGFGASFSVAVTLCIFIALLMRRRTPMEVLFLGGMLLVTVAGIITPEQAVRGFSNSAVIAIASLFVVVAGLRDTGVIDWIGHRLLGNCHTEQSALRRLALSLVSTSAFLLNTALVVMMVPVVLDWCRSRNISPSRLMIPVSYLTILGGVCSLVGTSTTLIVNSQLHEVRELRIKEFDEEERPLSENEIKFREQLEPMGLFEIGKIGLPCALIGTGVLLIFGRRLLPDRSEMIERFSEDRREYVFEMTVLPDCRLVDQTVEKAGLRRLQGVFLVEISRDQQIITPVRPTDIIRAFDRLVFAGVVDNIVELEKIAGLVPANDINDGVPAPQRTRRMAEAVLSRSSPLLGVTVKRSNFRERYNAAIIAVHRNGERLGTKIGDLILEPGDTLLLQTGEDFVVRFRNHPDFFLVSSVLDYSPRRHNKAWLAGLLGIALIALLTLSNFKFFQGFYPTFGLTAFPAIAAMLIAMGMVMTRCVSLTGARNAINLQVLLTIVGALALGKALQQSGAAEFIATALANGVQSLSFIPVAYQPWALLILLYLIGMIFTEMVTNNAVAAILVPLAVDIAEVGGYSPRPFVMAIALSASLAFLTPVGYQTNLMVMGPGGYRPTDFLRVGTPISISVAITATIGIPLIWPFY